MTAPKTDRRILRTRALLRQGLAELMQEKNAGDITVKELVAHANVNRSTFYLHYTDIDQMLASVEAELLERIEASVQAHPIDPHQAQIFPLVGDLFALMAENREICSALLGPHGDMAFLLQIEAILSRYSLQVLADAYPDRRVVVAFQPHRFSRTQALFGEFCHVLGTVDKLLLTEIYPASEKPIPGVNGQNLAQGIRQVSDADVSYFQNFDEMVAALPDILKPGDLFLTIGAGNVTTVGPRFLALE